MCQPVDREQQWVTGSTRTQPGPNRRTHPASRELRFLQTDAVSLIHCTHTHTHLRTHRHTLSLLLHAVFLEICIQRFMYTHKQVVDTRTHAHSCIQWDTLFLLWISDEGLSCWIMQEAQREKVAETTHGFGPEGGDSAGWESKNCRGEQRGAVCSVNTHTHTQAGGVDHINDTFQQ